MMATVIHATGLECAELFDLPQYTDTRLTCYCGINGCGMPHRKP